MTTEGNIAAVSPVLRPGVGSSYGNGWRQLWKHFLELFLILIVNWAFGLPSSIYSWVQDSHGFAASPGVAFYSLFSVVYGLLVVAVVGYGLALAYLKAARGDKVEVKDIFAAFQNYWNAVLANLLVGVIVVIGFILLIVPGIVFACKLAFVPYLVTDKKMGVIEAVKESWRMTSGGRSWKVFLIGLLAIPIFIAGLICLGVGVIISMMWLSMAMASLYYACSSLDAAKAVEPVKTA